MDYRRPLEFGISVVPETASLTETRTLVRVADESGLDLIGIQDHPYQWRFLDSWMLIASLLAETSHVRIFPDVANLPLRPPAMIAKEAASLDVLSGGRFELGLGAGGFWDAIEAMGGPRRTPGEAVVALAEAIAVIRQAWSGVRSVRFRGSHYQVDGYHPGPSPAHDIEIWIGAYKPRMLRLIGRVADGWIPSLGRTGIEELTALQGLIDEAATAAGRQPSLVRRLLNFSGSIDEVSVPGAVLNGSVEHFVETLTGWVVGAGFDTFILWPTVAEAGQVETYATDVVPGVKAEVTRLRTASTS